MSFTGYLRYAGTEVANTERLRAYLANGVAPAGITVTVPEVCEGLSAALGGFGWTPFGTPIQDAPPWYDVANPDTWDFAGVLPLEVTGLDDSTRTMETVARVAGGTAPGQVVRSGRTVGVTALLVARTTAGGQAGLSWLRSVLHGDCAVGGDCGPAGDLELMTSCPTPLVLVPNWQEPTSTTIPAPMNAGVSAADAVLWAISGGAYLGGGSAATTWSSSGSYEVGDLVVYGGQVWIANENYTGGAEPPPDSPVDGWSVAQDWPPATTRVQMWESPESYDAGGPGDMEDGWLDGGGVDGDLPLIDGGGVRPYGQVVVQGPRQGCVPPGTITLTWMVGRYHTADGTTVTPVVTDDAGIPLIYGPTVPVPDVDAAAGTITWEIPGDVMLGDAWRPGLLVQGVDILIGEVKVDGYDVLSTDECLEPYRRFYPTTMCVSGPTVVDQITPDEDCGDMLIQVEWVWESGSPYRYSPETPLVLNLTTDGATYTAPGVIAEYDGGGFAGPWTCTTPPVLTQSCAADPGNPWFTSPPAAPMIPDPNRVSIVNQFMEMFYICVGPEQVPRDGVFTLQLIAGTSPVVGLRVQLYEDVETDCTVPDKCAFVAEYNIDYIPANGVMTIGGRDGGVTTVCAGIGPQDATASVRGAYGGPLVDPIAQCDQRYYLKIMSLAVYPRTVVGVYTAGQPNGTYTINLSVAERED